MDESRLDYLFRKKIEGAATEEEAMELRELLRAPGHEARSKQLLDQAFENDPSPVAMNDQSAEQVLAAILATDKKETAREIPMRSRVFQKLAGIAAAAVLLSLGAFWFFNRDRPGAAKNIVTHDRTNGIKAPAASHAILTLSSGKQIALDEAVTGKITTESEAAVSKAPDGSIVYSGQGQEVVYHTITVPRGSRPLQLTLADGTSVWLNTASSITYPTIFKGAQRQVKIQGEVYFEVAHHATIPFVAQLDSVQVEVLGTHFNLNGYPDETGVQVTLLEGSVRVLGKNHSDPAQVKILQPGQQAVVAKSVVVMNKVDVQAVMAWKNGYFALDGTNLSSILRQISRWYDVGIRMEGTISEKKFEGAISRDISLADILTSLGEYGIEGRVEQGVLIIKSK